MILLEGRAGKSVRNRGIPSLLSRHFCCCCSGPIFPALFASFFPLLFSSHFPALSLILIYFRFCFLILFLVVLSSGPIFPALYFEFSRFFRLIFPASIFLNISPPFSFFLFLFFPEFISALVFFLFSSYSIHVLFFPDFRIPRPISRLIFSFSHFPSLFFSFTSHFPRSCFYSLILPTLFSFFSFSSALFFSLFSFSPIYFSSLIFLRSLIFSLSSHFPPLS